MWRPVLETALAEAGVDGLAELALADSPVLRADPDLRDLAHRSAIANLQLVIEVVRGAIDLADVEPPAAATAFARELARRNVGMSELAREYRAGQHAMWRFGVAELRQRLPLEQVAQAIEEYTDATLITGDWLTDRALERYSQERDRWVRSADAVRRATVSELLAGDPADVGQASARLRYELRREHVGFVVWARAEDAVLEAAAVAAGAALVVPLRAGLVAGWCAPGALNAAAADAPLAHGLPGTGLEGFRRSHAEALEARRVAGLTGAPVTAYGDVALVALLTHDEASAARFAARELGGLDDERLEETVREVLAQQGSPRRAAARLGVHENTVAKRIRSAEERLGHSIAERPVELLAALTIRAALSSKPSGSG